jgi:hypothetical protein
MAILGSFSFIAKMTLEISWSTLEFFAPYEKDERQTFKPMSIYPGEFYEQIQRM